MGWKTGQNEYAVHGGGNLEWGFWTLLYRAREKQWHVQLAGLRLLTESVCPAEGKKAEKSWDVSTDSTYFYFKQGKEYYKNWGKIGDFKLKYF